MIIKGKICRSCNKYKESSCITHGCICYSCKIKEKNTSIENLTLENNQLKSKYKFNKVMLNNSRKEIARLNKLLKIQ